ncbi:MAG: NAD-dependent DNA ligase LigA, partial [Candidatus Aerophobus sp.]
PENIELINKLKEAGLNFSSIKEVRKGKRPLAGQIFILTGKLSSLSREDATEIIEDLGGTVSNSVSSKTAYVVVGDSPGAKLGRAQKLGIPTLEEKEFIKLVKKD